MQRSVAERADQRRIGELKIEVPLPHQQIGPRAAVDRIIAETNGYEVVTTLAANRVIAPAAIQRVRRIVTN